MPKNVFLTYSVTIAIVAISGVANAAVTNYQVTLSGDQETPPVTTAATGTATLQHDDVTNLLTGTLTFTGLSGSATGAHVHKGAACTSGAVLEGMSTSSPVTVNVPVQGADLTELAAGRLYMNIHTAMNPNGEIRGQILPVGQSPKSCVADAGADAAADASADGSTPVDSGPPVDPVPDGGPTTVPSDAGATSSSSGSAAPEGSSSSDSGCSTGGGPPSTGMFAIAALGLALAARARRRRR